MWKAIPFIKFCKPMEAINRREFLKKLGLGGVAMAGTAMLASCGEEQKAQRALGTTFSEREVPTDKMTYRTTPTTGDKVSLLGYGMMRLPQDKDGNIDQEQVNRLVDYALAHGVNYFDTSPVYCKGQCEPATGIALSRHPRDSYFVAAKLSNFNPKTYAREESVKMYRKSFELLKVDVIDYYLLHSVGGGGMKNFSERYLDNGILDFLMEERAKGYIRNLGFSYHGDVEVFDWCLANHDKYHWDFVQIQMNYVDWRHGNEQNKRNQDALYLYTELEKRGIPAVIMEPLLGGRLSNLPTHVIERLKERRPQDSVASWAFRFCGHWPGVLTALSGMTYMEHLQDNIRTFSPCEPLSQEELDFLEETAQLILHYPTVPCNECQYCMPCPYGIDIPTIFHYYNKCVNEGSVPRSNEDPDYFRLRRNYLIGYDRALEKVRQADHCVGCGACTPHCPQNIRIPRELQRIDRFVENLRQFKI